MRIQFAITTTAAIIMACCSNPAQADGAVQLRSAVYIETAHATPDGPPIRRIEPAAALSKGDKVVLIVNWRSQPRGRGFAVTSPVPQALYFQGSSDTAQEVSVDGGQSWGRLGQLRIPREHRFATPEDVTHIRWQVPQTKARRGQGQITYSAIVR